MEKYQVQTWSEKKDIIVEVPGSKSITNRALLLAALSDGRVDLDGVLFSDDSRVFIKALQELGFRVETDEKHKRVTLWGEGGTIPHSSGRIYVGSAGTAARFLTAMTGLSGGTYEIDASEQMKRRPMKPLFDVLEALGTELEYMEEPWHLPVRVKGRIHSPDGNRIQVSLDIAKTSQPLSALLMTGVMLKNPLRITVTGEKKGGAYIDITRKMMREFGVEAVFDGENYDLQNTGVYHRSAYQIEPDVSAAGYFYGIGAITGGSALVRHVNFDTMQGDIRLLKVLEQMGCMLEETPDGIRLTGPKGKLKGLEVDMNNFSDQALTLAVVAIYADSPVTITNIGHIRGQECDRIHAITENMNRLHIRCEEGEDWVKIYPGEPEPAKIETFEDHRVAMAFAMAGLRSGGIEILNPMCCRKTFEDYFTILNGL